MTHRTVRQDWERCSLLSLGTGKHGTVAPIFSWEGISQGNWVPQEAWGKDQQESRLNEELEESLAGSSWTLNLASSPRSLPTLVLHCHQSQCIHALIEILFTGFSFPNLIVLIDIIDLTVSWSAYQRFKLEDMALPSCEWPDTSPALFHGR